MPNSDDYVITWFGILKAGAVMVPINTAYKMDFLEYIIESSDAEVLFIAEEYLDRMPPIAKNLSRLRQVIVWTRSGGKKFERHGYRFRNMISYSEFINSGSGKEPSTSKSPSWTTRGSCTPRAPPGDQRES